MVGSRYRGGVRAGAERQEGIDALRGGALDGKQQRCAPQSLGAVTHEQKCTHSVTGSLHGCMCTGPPHARVRV